MIKKTKIGNTEIGVQAGRRYRHHKIIGISFSRMVGIRPTMLPPDPVYHTFTINLWKYVFEIRLTPVDMIHSQGHDHKKEKKS